MRAAWAAVGVFALTCPLLWRSGPDGDVVELRRYGHAVLDGRLPYRDFRLEYPPGSILLFTPPALGHYVTWFRLENAVGWALVIVLVAALRPSSRLLLAGVALTPLALGPFALMRFDPWATACALGAVLAQVRRRPTAAAALLAAGTLVKVWPVVLLPLFLLYGLPRRALAAFAAVVVAALAPFAVLAPQNSFDAFVAQLHRPLEFEAIGASALLALDRPVRIFFDSGSWSVAGSGADVLATAHALVEVAVVAGVVWLFARSRRTAPRLLAAAATVVAAVAVLGKVLSPQYLLWLAPFAALAGAAAFAPFAAAALATRVVHDSWTGRPQPEDTATVAFLGARNALLLVTIALLLRQTFRSLRPDREGAPAASPSLARDRRCTP